jgi:flagellar biogenesis protein FliO
MRKLMIAGCAVLVLTLNLGDALASSVTVREVELKGNSTEITLDTAVDKNSVQVDFVRDIVQFSINNATIYPAKMLHADQAAFSKVFAYQYSPSLVRVRFSVENNAEKYKNKVKWSVDGKKVVIHFSAPVPVAQEDNEKSLLDKVTATVEKNSIDKSVEKPIEKVAASSQPLNLGLGNKKQVKLAGAKSGPSAFRSFLAMFLVVGGLGLILLYVKKKNAGGVQAKKAGGNWLSNLLPKSGKQKQLMEVVATHVLGPKQSIVVMKIRGQQFVLAVTAENIQLITQLDADEAELDLLDDPKVAASIGKMFGVNAKAPATIATPAPTADVSFGSLLKNSNGAGAIIARNAYASNSTPTVNPSADVQPAKPGMTAGGARDLIRKRLESIQ